MTDQKKLDDLQESIVKEYQARVGAAGGDPSKEMPPEYLDYITAELNRRLRTEKMSKDIEKKYLEQGTKLLSDTMPHRLDEEQKAEFKPLFSDVAGNKLDDVRIHTGEKAHEAAEAMGAKAFAIGTKDIFFNKNYYDPKSPMGKGLLAHELTHVYEDASPAPALSPVQPSATRGESERRASQKERQVRSSEAQSSSDVGASDEKKEMKHEELVEALTEKIWEMWKRSIKQGGDRLGRF
jgi:hypothetical protein